MKNVYSSNDGNRALARNSRDAEHTDPNNIAKYAIRFAKEENDKYQNGEDGEEPFFYKEVYCVVDVDDNVAKPNGNGSLPLAYQEIDSANSTSPEVKHRLIVSNECFEIWYILHFQNTPHLLYRGTKTQINSGITTHTTKIEAVLKRCIGWPSIPSSEKPSNGKIKSYRHFFQKMATSGNEVDAIRRAKELEKNSANKNPLDNPSTELYILIEKLNSFKL